MRFSSNRGEALILTRPKGVREGDVTYMYRKGLTEVMTTLMTKLWPVSTISCCHHPLTKPNLKVEVEGAQMIQSTEVNFLGMKQQVKGGEQLCSDKWRIISTSPQEWHRQQPLLSSQESFSQLLSYLLHYVQLITKSCTCCFLKVSHIHPLFAIPYQCRSSGLCLLSSLSASSFKSSLH